MLKFLSRHVGLAAFAVTLMVGLAYGQTALQLYQPGFRTIDGSQLNLMVNQVNALTGASGSPGTLIGSSLTVNASTGPVATGSLFAADAGTTIRTVGPNTTNNRIENDAIAGIPIFSARRTNGTIAAPTGILSGDEIGTYNFRGLNTTATYTGTARMSGFATENWSATAAGGKIVFSTVPNTTLVMTDALTIDQDGGLKGINAAQGTAVAITGGTSSTSGNAGGAVTATGGTPGLTGVGGGITLTSGAGGATSGAAGAVAVTAGSATSANGASVTITAGAGAGGTNAGGSVNLVPGAAVSTGIPGKVNINGNACLIPATYYFTGTPAATNQVFFIATRPVILTHISQVHSTAAGGTSTLDITKDSTTTAPAGGTALTSAAFNLNATANTVQVGALSATIATITMAAGDRLAVKFNNAIQASVGVVVTACMAPL